MQYSRRIIVTTFESVVISRVRFGYSVFNDGDSLFVNTVETPSLLIWYKITNLYTPVVNEFYAK
jgi:hypothetical protein